MEVGHIIAQLRASHNLSQKKLAERINVSTGVIGLWETDKRYPSYEYIIAIADYFKISTDVLFEKDRKLKPAEYSGLQLSDRDLKMLSIFQNLDEDNQDIIIGRSKELLKEQRREEKRVAILPEKQA